MAVTLTGGRLTVEAGPLTRSCAPSRSQTTDHHEPGGMNTVQEPCCLPAHLCGCFQTHVSALPDRRLPPLTMVRPKHTPGVWQDFLLADRLGTEQKRRTQATTISTADHLGTDAAEMTFTGPPQGSSSTRLHGSRHECHRQPPEEQRGDMAEARMLQTTPRWIQRLP